MSETGDIRIDEIMPSLNCNWPIVAFEESLIERQPKYKKLKAKEISASGEIPVIDQGEAFIAGYTNDIANMFKGPLPVIIFGDHTRRFKFVDFDFAIGADGTRPLYPRQELDPKFFYHYLTALNLESQGYSRHYKFLKEASVPIPKLEEQHRIVTKLEVLFSKVDASKKRLERIPVLLKRFRQSVLAAACSGRLTEDWREQNKVSEDALSLLAQMKKERLKRWSDKNGKRTYREPFALQDEQLPDIPDTWSWTNFDHCAWEITVGHVGPMKDRYTVTGTPFLRCQNVRPLHFEPDGLVHIPADFNAILSKSKLVGGEILVVRSGANTGDCCVFPRTLGEANCSDLVITRPLSGLTSEYGALYVSSPYGQSQLTMNQTGIAQPHFNIGAMKVKAFPLAPLEEQIEIVKRIEELFKLADEIQARYEKGKAFVDKLTQSILAKAFRGELVPQDPNDTPAERMLERNR